MRHKLEGFVSHTFLNCKCRTCKEHKEIIKSILDGEATSDMFVIAETVGYSSFEKDLLLKDRIKAALMPKKQSNDP